MAEASKISRDGFKEPDPRIANMFGSFATLKQQRAAQGLPPLNLPPLPPPSVDPGQNDALEDALKP